MADNENTLRSRSKDGNCLTKEGSPITDKPPDRPIHKQTDSLISQSSGFSNYRGFLNLCIIILVLSNFRVALENLMKYGILIDPIFWIRRALEDSRLPNTVLLILSNIFILFDLWVEKRISAGHTSELHANYMHTANLSIILILPAVVILVLHPFPMFSMWTMTWYTIVFLKLISFNSVNSWCREWIKKNPGAKTPVKEGEVFFPENLTIDNLYYFIVAPTLCYELNFPRTERIRKRFLIKRIFEMILLSQIILGMIQQWIYPTVRNALQPFHDMELPKMVERICKLAIPNIIIWLIFFYWLFHSCLNAVGEILRFGDREFYKDWWNSESVEYFWQNWNVCVHRWCVRHLYKPLLYRGYSKFQAAVAVFFASAFFHEYLVSVPLCMFRLWAFMAMFFQLPLALFVSRYLKGISANMAVWISLIVGQPIAILMYVHDYYIMHLVRATNANATQTV